MGRVHHAQPHQYRRHGTFRRAPRAVADLERHAHPLFRQDRQIAALGPALQARAAFAGAHQAGAGAAFARHQLGMLRHRGAQPHHRGGARIAAVMGAGKGGGAGKAVDAGGKIRGRAAVDGKSGAVLAGDLFKGRAHRALHRVVGVDIFRPAAQMRAQREEPRVLARAIVVDLARAVLRPDQPLARVAVVRHLRPAAKGVVTQAKRFQPAAHPVGMDRGPLMRGAGQRQLFGPEPMRLRRAAFDQRQGLHHLAGRTRVDHGLRVAPGLDDLAGVVADHRMTAMQAFDHPAPPDFHKIDRLRHRVPLQARVRPGDWGFPVCAVFC